MMRLSWMRAQLGYVSSETLLHSYSVADNIGYGDNSREVSRDEVILAAQKADAHDFIVSLPEGYDTVIPRDGGYLSLSQMRRIGLARALLRDPKILLIDDAVEGLDAKNEKVVREAIRSVCKGRTCVIVTARLWCVRDVDRIFVMQKGKVVEKGSHDELMSRGGVYHKLFTEESSAR
ncbi:ATP-dependent translocase ABCB1 [Ixodes scapularis]